MEQKMTAILFHNLLSQNGIILRRKQVACREEAQSLIELALLVPLFIILLLGSAEFARFAWASILAANAARAGASYGSQSAVTAKDQAAIQSVASNDSLNLGGLVATPTISCACSDGTTLPQDCSNSVSLCKSPATVFNYVTVTATATVTPLMHYPGLSGQPFTATGRSTMVIEQ